MVMEALELEITELTPAEAARVWKRQSKRAPNFSKYQIYVNTHDVGHSWNTRVPLDTITEGVPAVADSKEGAESKLADGRIARLRKNAAGALAWQAASLRADDYIKTIKHNFNDAAKERTIYADVTPTVREALGDAAGAAKSGDTYKLADGRVASLTTDGKWTAETAAPLIIRWKANQHKESRIVTNGNKKPTTIEVTVVDSLDALLAASEAVQTRAPRAQTEEVTALVTNPPAGAKKGAKVTLPDGRQAIFTAAGKWRAPKLETPTTPTANGASDNVSSGNNADTAKETAGASA